MRLRGHEPEELRRHRELERIHGELTLAWLDLAGLDVDEIAGDVLDLADELRGYIEPIEPPDPTARYHRRMQRLRARLELIRGGRP